MKKMMILLVSVAGCLVSISVLAAPDTAAAVRARAHAEIAARDAQIVHLQKQVQDDTSEIARLRASLAANPVPNPTPSFIPAPAVTDGIEADTRQALDDHHVTMTANITEVFGTTADVNLSIHNLSEKPIRFYGVPTLYYGRGLYSDLKVQKVGNRPFPAPVNQVEDAFAAALAGPGRGTYSGTILLPGDDPTPENTVIAPYQVLYARATCPLFGDDHTPTKITFQGGAWNKMVFPVR